MGPYRGEEKNFQERAWTCTYMAALCPDPLLLCVHGRPHVYFISSHFQYIVVFLLYTAARVSGEERNSVYKPSSCTHVITFPHPPVRGLAPLLHAFLSPMCVSLVSTTYRCTHDARLPITTTTKIATYVSFNTRTWTAGSSSVLLLRSFRYSTFQASARGQSIHTASSAKCS